MCKMTQKVWPGCKSQVTSLWAFMTFYICVTKWIKCFETCLCGWATSGKSWSVLRNIVNKTCTTYSCLCLRKSIAGYQKCTSCILIPDKQMCIVYWVRHNMLFELKQRLHGAHQLHNLITRTSAWLYPHAVPTMMFLSNQKHGLLFTWSIK